MLLEVTAKNTRDEVVLDGGTVLVNTLESGRIGKLATSHLESSTVVTGVVSGRELFLQTGSKLDIILWMVMYP